MQNKQKFTARQIIPPQLIDTDKSQFIADSKAQMLFSLARELTEKCDEVKFEEYKTEHYTPWLK